MYKELKYFKDIASEYVRQRIYAEEVDIQSVKLMDSQPIHVVIGKALKRSIDLNTSQCGVWEQCYFTLQITDEDGSITGEEFGNWVSCEQNADSKAKTVRSYDVDVMLESDSSLAKRYGINPHKFRL